MTDDNLPAETVWVFGDQLNRRIGALGMAARTHRILFVEATADHRIARLPPAAPDESDAALVAAAARRRAVRARASEVLSRLDAGEL